MIEAVPHFDGAFDPTPFEPPSPPKPKVKGRVKHPGYMKIRKSLSELTRPYTNRVRYIIYLVETVQDFFINLGIKPLL